MRPEGNSNKGNGIFERSPCVLKVPRICRVLESRERNIKEGGWKKDNELEVDPFYGEKTKCSTLAVMSLLAPVLD